VAEQRANILGVVSSSPGALFIKKKIKTLLYPCCVVKRSESQWKSQFEAFCGIKSKLFFSGKDSGAFLKKFRISFPEKFRSIA
jgi:hypothetical protein